MNADISNTLIGKENFIKVITFANALPVGLFDMACYLWKQQISSQKNGRLTSLNTITWFSERGFAFWRWRIGTFVA
jgi:hypothetical protein